MSSKSKGREISYDENFVYVTFTENYYEGHVSIEMEIELDGAFLNNVNFDNIAQMKKTVAAMQQYIDYREGREKPLPPEIPRINDDVADELPEDIAAEPPAQYGKE